MLKDLVAEHGAVRLTELVRFSDPAEAAASLALREGRPDALGFYLDQGRVHIGDAGSTLDQAFIAWAADRASGLGSLMLAPTRDLVAELNRRARDHRLSGTAPDAEVCLSDGNRASAGDTVVTRRNERRLQFSRTGWVRNGDRWTVTGVGRDRSLTVANERGFRITLPAEYVRAHVELGYATTIHGAQGSTVDTMHGVLTGAESRQQLYTMMTRGRLANHAYVQMVGDGDPDGLPRWETAMPPTPTEVLESVLARDEAALSATGLRRVEADPATQLKPAVDRYVDALGFAAEQVVGRERAALIEADAERVAPEVTGAPAWPVLRSQLMLLAVSGADPVGVLRDAVLNGGLDDARDPTAVLSWRLDRVERGGPLPWLSGVPKRLTEHPQWGPYLASRSELVRDLAAQVREASGASEPRWQEALSTDLSPELVAHVSVWRAAMGVPADDPSPTGSTQVPGPAARWQHVLDDHLELSSPTLRHWTAVVRQLAPQLRDDPQTPVLAAKLAALANQGEDMPGLLERALRRRPLPDEHAAAALLYRLERRPRHEPIDEVWETIRPSESMGQRDERMRPPGIDLPHGPGIGI